MLKGETLALGKLLESTMMTKYGPAELSQHFMVMDTICDATQVGKAANHSCILNLVLTQIVDLRACENKLVVLVKSPCQDVPGYQLSYGLLHSSQQHLSKQ